MSELIYLIKYWQTLLNILVLVKIKDFTHSYLRPTECLWPLTHEAIANKCFETLKELEEVPFQGCRVLLRSRELIYGLTFCHWLPDSS